MNGTTTEALHIIAIHPPSTEIVVPVIWSARQAKDRRAADLLNRRELARGWRCSMTLAMTSSRLMLWVFIWSGICFSTMGVST